MKQFPFPGRENSMDDLMRDTVYSRIPENEREKLCDLGWQHGLNTAAKIINDFGLQHIESIATQKGINLLREEREKIAGGLRYFSEFFEKEKKVVLYTVSVKKFASENRLTYSEAEELILAHEFYHYMECYETGNTAALYQVPILKLGNMVLMKSNVRALSEIAANAFARAYWENRYGSVTGEMAAKKVFHNAVLSDNKAYQGREYAEKLYGFVFGEKFTKKHDLVNKRSYIKK